MTITRRKALHYSMAAATVSLTASPLRYANAAEFNYKYGGELSPDHPTSIYARKAADRIKQETNGRLEIKVFPNNQLGSSTDQLAQLRSGALEFFATSGTILSTFVPATSIDGVGFAFSSEEDAFKAMDGKLGAYIRNQIRKSNLVVMDKIWGHGFRHMTSSNKPIVMPEDFRALKMRVPPTQLWTSMFKALGANPSTLNFSETYTALQTKVVDAQENPLVLIDTSKMYEVQKYLSLTSHIWGGIWFLSNRRAFDRLPPDVRDVVIRVVDETATAQRAELKRLDAGYRQRLADKGMVLNSPAAAPFKAALTQSGFYQEWKKKYGAEAWELLENYVGKVA